MKKYRGVIIVDGDFSYRSKEFRSVKEAEEWIRKNNNNLEFKSRVEELDEAGNAKDWFTFS